MVMTCVAAGVLTWKMPSDDILKTQKSLTNLTKVPESLTYLDR